ncbi:MAG TPA: hypothetical protein VNP03_14740 [Pseudonocardia sp.]|nr:hypothetical protein [Pseudonocardia sp.]
MARRVVRRPRSPRRRPVRGVPGRAAPDRTSCAPRPASRAPASPDLDSNPDRVDIRDRPSRRGSRARDRRDSGVGPG